MKRRLLPLTVVAIAGISLAAGTGVANAGLSLSEATTGLPAFQLLTGGLDPLITDTAVTATDLATSGVVLDTTPTMENDSNTLVVDDDKVQCPDAQFTSINAAVLAAPPGAHIRVCPGIYHESVLITKPLTLQAARREGEATECKGPNVDDPTEEAIVKYNTTLNGGNPAEGFDVEASHVKIEGFKVEPDVIVAQNGVGIFTSRAFSGYDIRHNVVQNNSIGIYVNSNGSSPTNVSENCSRNNNLNGAAGGNGVYSDQGLSNAQITENYFTGDQNGAIIIDTFLTAPHDIAITHNESVNDGAIGTFASNGPPAYNLDVEHNKVVGSVGSGIVTTNVINSEYDYNDVDNGTFNGISLHATSNSSVKSNRADGFQLAGIRIADSSNNNTVANNRAEDNKQAGLAATAGSSGNMIQQNRMTRNNPDCYDDTVGPGTAGTANYWIKDFGRTENRPGLCKRQSEEQD